MYISWIDQAMGSEHGWEDLCSAPVAKENSDESQNSLNIKELMNALRGEK